MIPQSWDVLIKNLTLTLIIKLPKPTPVSKLRVLEHKDVINFTFHSIVPVQARNVMKIPTKLWVKFNLGLKSIKNGFDTSNIIGYLEIDPYFISGKKGKIVEQFWSQALSNWERFCQSLCT
jgi:hypothetical protein